MVDVFRPSQDLALRHALEAGLSLIADKPLSHSGHTETLRTLIDLLTDAKHGAAALSGHGMLFASERSSEFERFNLFYIYLQGTFGNELPTRIGEAATVLGSLERREEPNEGMRQRAFEFVQRLLSELDRERALQPLVQPREINYG